MGVTALDPSVPIIGDSFKIVTGFSTVVIQCQCAAKTVLVLQGKNAVKQCPGCHRGFAIAKAGGLEVGEVLMSPDVELEH